MKNLEILTIEANQKSRTSLKEIFQNLEILKTFLTRDIKVKYRQSVLGITWVALQPVTFLLIYSIIFGRFIKLPTQGIPYSLYCLTGMICWRFFSQSVSLGMRALVSESTLISKVYFPRIFIPLTATLSQIPDLLISIAVLSLFMIYYKVTLTFSILFFVFILLILIILTFSTILLSSALCAKYRDVQFVIPFVLQIMFWLSPVVYSDEIVTGLYRYIIYLNPLTYVIQFSRSCLFSVPTPPLYSAISCYLFCAIFFVYSIKYFNKIEKFIVDVI